MCVCVRGEGETRAGDPNLYHSVVSRCGGAGAGGWAGAAPSTRRTGCSLRILDAQRARVSLYKRVGVRGLSRMNTLSAVYIYRSRQIEARWTVGNDVVVSAAGPADTFSRPFLSSARLPVRTMDR